MSPKCVPSLLPPLYDAPPVDQVEDKEEEREQTEEDHVSPAMSNFELIVNLDVCLLVWMLMSIDKFEVGYG